MKLSLPAFLTLLLAITAGCSSPAPVLRVDLIESARVVVDLQFEKNILRPIDIRLVPVSGVIGVGFTQLDAGEWGVEVLDDKGSTFLIGITRTEGSRFVLAGLPDHTFGESMSIQPSVTLVVGRGGRWFRLASDSTLVLWRRGQVVPDWERPEGLEGGLQAQSLNTQD